MKDYHITRWTRLSYSQESNRKEPDIKGKVSKEKRKNLAKALLDKDSFADKIISKYLGYVVEVGEGHGERAYNEIYDSLTEPDVAVPGADVIPIFRVLNEKVAKLGQFLCALALHRSVELRQTKETRNIISPVNVMVFVLEQRYFSQGFLMLCRSSKTSRNSRLTLSMKQSAASSTPPSRMHSTNPGESI